MYQSQAHRNSQLIARLLVIVRKIIWLYPKLLIFKITK